MDTARSGDWHIESLASLAPSRSSAPTVFCGTVIAEGSAAILRKSVDTHAANFCLGTPPHPVPGIPQTVSTSPAPPNGAAAHQSAKAPSRASAPEHYRHGPEPARTRPPAGPPVQRAGSTEGAVRPTGPSPRCANPNKRYEATEIKIPVNEKGHPGAAPATHR